jgi:hypothetical protein
VEHRNIVDSAVALVEKTRMRARLLGPLLVAIGCTSTQAPAPRDLSAPADLRAAFDDAAYMDALDASTWAALCQWMVDTQGGPHSVSCDGGVSVTIDPVSDCLTQTARPHCTVGVFRACITAQARDLCADAPPECKAFYACAGSI